MAKFIYDYQSLLGSFLAVTFAIGFWYFQRAMEKRRERDNNKKEIENIFWMAARESEDAVKDLNGYIKEARPLLGNLKKEMVAILPPRFNRVYINEERLFSLKYDLGFAMSQQIDIAASAAKKLNGYINQIEAMPAFLLDTQLKIAQVGFIPKEQLLEKYAADLTRFFDGLIHLLVDIDTAQKHLFRPIVAAHYKRKELEEMMKRRTVDKVLDAEAGLMLVVLKADSE